MPDDFNWDLLLGSASDDQMPPTGPPGSEHMTVRQQYAVNAYLSGGSRRADQELDHLWGINRTEGGLRGLGAAGANLGLRFGQLMGTIGSAGQWDTSITLPPLELNKEMGETFDLANRQGFMLRAGRTFGQAAVAAQPGTDPYLRKYLIDSKFLRSHKGSDGVDRTYISWDALPANKRALFTENVKTPREALQFFESMSGEYWKQNLIQQHNLGFWSSMSSEIVNMGNQQEYFAEDIALFGFFNWGRRVMRIGHKALVLSRIPIAAKLANDGTRTILRGAEATAAVAAGEARMLARGGRMVQNFAPGSGAAAKLLEANNPGAMYWKQQLAAAGMFVGVDQARLQTMTMQKNLLLDREEIGKYIAFSAAYGLVGSSLVRWQINSMHKTSETTRHARTWDRLMRERMDTLAQDLGLTSRAEVPDDMALDTAKRLLRDMENDGFKEFGEMSKPSVAQWLWGRVFRYADTVAEGSPSPVFKQFIGDLSDSMAKQKSGAAGSFVSAKQGYETANQAVQATIKKLVDDADGPIMPGAVTMGDSVASHNQGVRIIIGEIGTNHKVPAEEIEAAVRKYAADMEWMATDSQVSAIVKAVNLYRDRLDESVQMMFVAGGVNRNFVDINDYHAVRLWLLDAIDARPDAFKELMRASLVERGVERELGRLGKTIDEIDDVELQAIRDRLSSGTPAVEATDDTPAIAARQGAIRDAEEIMGGLTGVSLRKSSPHAMQGTSAHRSRGIRVADDFTTEWVNPETGVTETLRIKDFMNSDPLHVLEHLTKKMGPSLFSAEHNAEPFVKELLLSASELFNQGNYAGAHNQMVSAQIAEILSNTGQTELLATFKRNLDTLAGLADEHQQVLGDAAAWLSISRDFGDIAGESVKLHPQTEGYRAAEAILLDILEGNTGTAAHTAKIEKSKRLARIREEQADAVKYGDDADRYVPTEPLADELDDMVIRQELSRPGADLLNEHPIIQGGPAAPKEMPEGSTPLKEVEKVLEGEGAVKVGQHWMLPIKRTDFDGSPGPIPTPDSPQPGYVMLELGERGGYVHLDYIHVAEELRGKGHASRALDLITRTVDEYGIPLELALDTTATKKSVLLKVYGKHGFERVKAHGRLQDTMRRAPFEREHVPGSQKFDDVPDELYADNRSPSTYGSPRNIQTEVSVIPEDASVEAAEFAEYAVTMQPGPLPVNAEGLQKIRVTRADGRLTGEGRGVWTKAEVLAAREAAHALYFYLPVEARKTLSEFLGGFPDDLLLSHSGLGHVVPKKAKNNSEAFMEAVVRVMAGDDELLGFANHVTDLPAFRAFIKEYADGFRVGSHSRKMLDIRRGKLPRGRLTKAQATAKGKAQGLRGEAKVARDEVSDLEASVRAALHSKGAYEEIPIGPMRTDAEAALARAGAGEATGQPKRVTSKQNIDSMLRDIVAIMRARGTGKVIDRAELEALRMRVNPAMEEAIDRVVSLDATRTGYENSLDALRNVHGDVNKWLYDNSKVNPVWGNMLYDDMKYRQPIEEFVSAFDAGVIHKIDPRALKGGIVKAGQKQYDRAKEWQWTAYRMMKDWTERFGTDQGGRVAREQQLDLFKDVVQLIHRRTGQETASATMESVNRYLQKTLYGMAAVPMSFTQINDIASPMFVLGLRDWATGYMPEFVRSLKRFKKEAGMSWEEMLEHFETSHHYATMDGLNEGLGPGRLHENPVSRLTLSPDADPYPLAAGIPAPIQKLFNTGERVSELAIEYSMHQIVARTRVAGGHAAQKMLYKHLKGFREWAKKPVNALQVELALSDEQAGLLMDAKTRSLSFKSKTLPQLAAELDLNEAQLKALGDAVTERGSLQQVMRDLKKSLKAGEDYGMGRMRQLGLDTESASRLGRALESVDYDWEKLPLRWKQRVRTAIIQYQNNMNPVPTITNTAKWHRSQWGQLVFAFMRFLTAAPSRHLPNAMQRGGIGAALAAHAGTTMWSFMIEGILRPLAKGEGLWDGWEKPIDQWDNTDWARLLRIVNGNGQYGFLPETFSAMLSGHDRSRLAAYAAAANITKHGVKAGKSLFDGEYTEAAKEIGLAAGGVFGLGALETAWKQTKAWRED